MLFSLIIPKLFLHILLHMDHLHLISLPVVVSLPSVALIPLCRACVRVWEIFWRLKIILLSTLMIIFIIPWITLIILLLQSRIGSRKPRNSFVYFILNRRSDPGETSFAKGLKFAGSLCLTRSCLNWFISIIDVPIEANECITGVSSPPLWISLSHDTIIAYEALTSS